MKRLRDLIGPYWGLIGMICLWAAIAYFMERFGGEFWEKYFT